MFLLKLLHPARLPVFRSDRRIERLRLPVFARYWYYGTEGGWEGQISLKIPPLYLSSLLLPLLHHRTSIEPTGEYCVIIVQASNL